MAPGMMGRLSDRFHHKSSPTKAGGALNPRATTPNNPSPRARSPGKSPRKHLRFGRSTISKATDALKSAKKLAPEAATNSIFSSPIRPQLDSAGKPACVRYIADYACGHSSIEQHPCGEHEPAFCLDIGHCVTANMKKDRKCNECSVAEVAQMLGTTSQSFPDPCAPPDHPMMNPRASPAARSAIKSRIAKRIAELGPLGEVKSSPHSVANNKDDTAETATGNAQLFTVNEFLRDEVAYTEAMNDGDSHAPSIKGLSPAVLAAKNAIIARALARNRTVSEAPLSTTELKDSRASSASFRPLPPLPTPVNFDAEAMADKAYKRVSQEMIGVQHGIDAETKQRERENAVDIETDTTHMSILNEQVLHSSNGFIGVQSENVPFQTQSQEDDKTATDAETHVVFVEKTKKPDEHAISEILDDSDISELTLSNGLEGYDPFVDHDDRRASLPVLSAAERPLPAIPIKIRKRHSMSSPSDRLERQLVASRSMQNMTEGDAESSSAPVRHAPEMPPSTVKFADFDFNLEYKRGKLGYIGRMGQKGSGDDFNNDWKLEYPARDYSKDETATGELWENKHGFGYTGLKRYLNKLEKDRKANKNQGNRITKIGREESINFSSPRPNKESSIWSRRWARNVGFSIPAPALHSSPGAEKTDIDCLIKKEDSQTVVLKTAKKETFKGIPWDRTMIGCAL